MEQLYNEKRNNRIALAVTTGVAILLLFLFLTVMCGRSDGPPFPIEEIGVSVDFGTVDEGSGDPILEDPTQETSPVESPIEEQSDEEPVEDPIDEVEETESSEPNTTAEETTPDPLPVDDEGTEQVQENTSSSNNNNESTQETTTSRPFRGGMTARTDGTTKNAGDEGNPDVPPTLDDHTGGGDNGGGFKIAGWKWAGEPDWSKVGDGYGKISFDIDEFGEVSNIRIDNSSFTPSDKVEIEKIIRKLVFEKVSSGEITGKERVSGILDRRGY